MGWGTELWDSFDKVAKYFQEGIEFFEKYEEFLRERCAIENTYAKSLRKLVKNYESNKKLVPKEIADDEAGALTHIKSFQKSLGEMRDMASQHELIAENTHKRVIEKLNGNVKSFKEDRRKCIDERDKLYAAHMNSDEILKKAKVKYEAAFKDMVKAKDVLERVERDDSYSRNDIKKQQAICEMKSVSCNSCKGEYAKQQIDANVVKNRYYTEQLPRLLDTLQQLEETRLKSFRDMLNDSVAIENEVIPRIKQCQDGILDASNSISIENDINFVINSFKTGYSIPPDHPFEDLSEKNAINNSQNSTRNATLSVSSLSSSSNTGRNNKYRTINRIRDLFTTKTEMDSLYELPPQQQRKEITKKIEQLNADLSKEQKEREGLQKLKDIYSSNQKFGDSQSAMQALKENEEKIASLTAQQRKYQEMLDDLDKYGSLARSGSSSSNTKLNGTPLSQHKSLGHSSSELSLNNSSDKNNARSVPSTPISEQRLERSSSKKSLTKNSRQDESFDDEIDNDDYPGENWQSSTPSNTFSQNSEPQYEHIGNANPNGDQYDGTMVDVIIGSALVVYTFEGSVQNSISIYENESLCILERDSGDGWTLVKRSNGDKGYVPTGYIKIEYFA